MHRFSAVLLFVAVAGWSQVQASAADDYFAIQVVDSETGRGVPLVELETTNNIRYVTDSNGLVAFDESALFGRRVFFSVRSHGYEFAKDGFGYRGKALNIEPGGSATLEIKRLNIAQRLYRMTGGGIYRDSVLLGREVPIEQPLLNAQVLGQDSVVNAVYEGRIHWFWGDTNQPAYPLGNFNAPGAVSELPSQGGLDPDVGVNLTYFVDEKGFARPAAKMPGEGPTWIDALTTLTDPSGEERLFCAYVKIKAPMEVYARGIAEWNDQTQRFDKLADLPLNAPASPGGHPFKHTAGGRKYVYFARGYPFVRVPATPAAYLDLNAYEAFTPLVEGSDFDAPQLDRGEDGTLHYSWKKDTPPLTHQEQKKLIDAGLMKPEESVMSLRDRDTGKPILSHGGSVYWNEHRGRWVMICLEGFGSPSFLGEVWYAEGDSPVGPWVYAVKVVTHDRYDFYNPKQHPMFDKDGGRTIYFEGTYTNTFSGNPVKTPRYDYNQMMYKLNLDDPRLALPVPIYRSQHEDGPVRFGDRRAKGFEQADEIAFFALDRAGEGTVPIYERNVDKGKALMTSAPPDAPRGTPVFFALPTDAENAPATVRPLYEFVSAASGERRYSVDQEAPAGFERSDGPVCLVWENPLRNVSLENDR